MRAILNSHLMSPLDFCWPVSSKMFSCSCKIGLLSFKGHAFICSSVGKAIKKKQIYHQDYGCMPKGFMSQHLAAKVFSNLQERKVAVDSLLVIGRQFQAAQAALTDRLAGRSDISEHHSLETFLQTVKAASDVRTVATNSICYCLTHLL